MIEPWIFWLITIIYIVITIYLAYLGWKRTHTNEDFLVAGRKVNPMIIGLSYGATFISTSAIVGFGGVAAQLGMGLIWLNVLNISIGILLAFVVFGKRARRIGHKLKAMTFPEMMGRRFNSNFVQYTSAIIILISMPLYSSAVLIGGSRFIETTLGVPYNYALLGFAVLTAGYVIAGGILAVMYTDAFQGGIMMFGMSAILILTYYYLGGVTDANQALTNLASHVPKALASQGMTGWTTFPNLGSPLWLTMVTTIIMGVGIGVLAQPQLVIRFLTAKDDKTLNRAVPIGGIFILLMTGVAFTVGALTNAYFFNNPSTLGMISWAPPGTTGVGVSSNVDNIIPIYINDAMPPVIVVLFMLTLLAAAMSTLSSIFHTMGSAAGHDVWINLQRSRLMGKKDVKDQHPKSTLRANKIGTGIMIIASIGLAFVMPSNIIARATAMFMGLCAAAFLPMYTYGLFSKKPYRLAAVLSLVVGALVWFIWTVFFHIAESKPLGICQWLFGRPAVWGLPWQNLDPMVIALPCSVAALTIGWYIDSRKDKNRETAVSV